MRKILSFMLIISLLLSMTTPVVYATENENIFNIAQGEKYIVHGFEDETKRFNIMIDTEDETGQFAVVYLDKTDYVYEFCFGLNEMNCNLSDVSWNDIETFCFNSYSLWREIYIPTSVVVNTVDEMTVTLESENIVEPYDASEPPDLGGTLNEEDHIMAFESMLEDKYGNEYVRRQLASTTYEGLNMYLKSSLDFEVTKKASYYISVAMTVTAFVTNKLGLTGKLASAAIRTLKVLLDSYEVFASGTNVNEYKLQAHYTRYVTLVSGLGYPYGMVMKTINHTGFFYDETVSYGMHETSIDYSTSSESFNSYSAIYDLAYDDYLFYGWREDGNF